MPPDAVIGWDVGGAHLKAARLEGGRVAAQTQLPCPLWRGLPYLEEGLDQARGRLGNAPARHAVTMTGELVDLFPDRHSGVSSLAKLVADHLAPEPVHLYAGTRGFVAPERAGPMYHAVASANWLASAAFCARHVDEALFVDCGSTTTDLVVLQGGDVHPTGLDDAGRMAADELVYTGVVRTPVMALAARLPFEGAWITPMAEHFATAADVYRVLGRLPAHADLAETADGGSADLAGSIRRLARMIGRDAADAPVEAWVLLAEHLAACQRRQIADAATLALSRGRLGPDAPLLGAGVGRFVLQEVAAELGRPYRDFTTLFTATRDAPLYGDGGDCAPAVAVASLLEAQP